MFPEEVVTSFEQAERKPEFKPGFEAPPPRTRGSALIGALAFSQVRVSALRIEYELGFRL